MKETLVVPLWNGEIHVFSSDTHHAEWMQGAVAAYESTKHLRNARGLRDAQSEPVAMLGIYCEYPVAFALGYSKTDDLGVDAGPHQVKATEYDNGRLIVPPYQLEHDFKKRPVHPGAIYILVTAEKRRHIKMRGWATREEILAAPLDEMMNPQRPLIHVLDQRQLHRMDELPRRADEDSPLA